jgi:hypothetical protein
MSWTPEYPPGDLEIAFRECLDPISQHLKADGVLTDEWSTEMQRLLRGFHTGIITTFHAERDARGLIAKAFISNNLADAIVSTEEGGTYFRPYQYVIIACSLGLFGLVRMWRIYETRGSSIKKDIQYELNMLGFRLTGLYLGDSKMPEWESLERIRCAVEGPPEEGMWEAANEEHWNS